MHYDVVCGAGAGDILRSMYWDGWYAAIEEMAPEDTCAVYMPSLNPHSSEFLKWHPRIGNGLNVVQLPYIVPDEDEQKRREFGVPLEGDYIPLPRSTKSVVFYPSPRDEHILNQVDDCRRFYWQPGSDMVHGENLVVLSPGAGTRDRNLPYSLHDLICEASVPNHFITASVGRTFERQDRTEPDWSANMMLIDQLSLPGTCKLLEGAAGLVTCHSALSMLAFLIHKPQILLYPEEVRQRHFLQPDMWSFGASESICVHGTFKDFHENPDSYINRFLESMKAGDR